MSTELSKNVDTFPRFHPQQPELSIAPDIEPLDLKKRLAWPPVEDVISLKAQEKLYSFVARDMPLAQALALFGRAYELNVLLDKDISGVVNVEFHDLPFDQAMTALLSAQDYFWQREGELVRVKSWQTKRFTIDYIGLTRQGNGSSEAMVSTGSDSGTGGDGGGDGAGKISIVQANTINFWEDLEKQLKVMVSDKGRLVMNRIAGTVQVTDRHHRIEEISHYIDQINQAVHRQVDIEVRILEVTLNDDYSLGIDWSRLVSQGKPSGGSIDFNIGNTITTLGSGNALSPALNLTASNIGDNGENKLTSIISALKQQGEVQIVSQPHILTMNNQPALIKVGTDRTFFRREQSTDNTTAGSTTTSTDVPQVVTEGIVLSITPQISRHGWVMMDVSPVVTRVSSVAEVKDSAGRVSSSAPNLDIRQTSSLIRVFNGDTAIIGGLIQTQQANADRGVPGLNELPGVGGLFNGKYRSQVKKELVIFLTPRLIKSHQAEGPGQAGIQ